MSGGECRWVAYGDSVVFHYNRRSGLLEHSFTRLSGNSDLLRAAETIRFDFQADVLMPLLKAAEKVSAFKGRVKALIAHGVLDADDMTVVILGKM